MNYMHVTTLQLQPNDHVDYMQGREVSKLEMVGDNFSWAVEQMADVTHAIEIEKGFVDPNKPIDVKEEALKILLSICELAELVEGLRDGNPPCPKLGMEMFSNAEEEAADAVIRIMNLCKRNNWRLGEAIVAKTKYNAGRPHKHGRQF